MPIYEYRCDDCGATFDRLVRADAGETPPCPACGAATRRLMSRVAAVPIGGASCAPGGT